jgi:hypothetical protein
MAPVELRVAKTEQINFYGIHYTEGPTSYRTQYFFDNFTTNEDIAMKFEADLPHCVRNVTTS